MAAALVLSRVGPTGAAAPAIAAAILIAVLVSELGRPRPERQHGTGAALEVRRIRDYVKPAAVVGVLLTGLVLMAELAWLLAAGTWHKQDSGYAWSSPTAVEVPALEANGSAILYELVCVGQTPDLVERSFLAVTVSSDLCQDEEPQAEEDWAAGEGVVGAAFGTIGTALAALLLGPLVLRATVRTPRAGADDQTRERDERWRRGTVSTVVATVGWVLTVPLALWNITLLLAEDSDSLSGPVDYLRLALFALLAAGGMLGAAFSATALSRAPR
jgi:hypothetical protein